MDFVFLFVLLYDRIKLDFTPFVKIKIDIVNFLICSVLGCSLIPTKVKYHIPVIPVTS